ncbi:hypothetical protein CYLTODRAFT_472107 [Cylindrobasidium torrendii FP15055 ss-10]|uniref:Uncharacterized protein n=1 Tax=Cylindrobasidium torrendii FP15055 ss-10 TaxID=1314674 RepID=A0A0D7AZA9_9AGAR|nr:hypothetical protein CYLTODRAFT_472107 [Cylindrobasidium torrendii FP15055 ss-10]
MASVKVQDAESANCQIQKVAQHPDVVVYRFNEMMVYAKGDPNYDGAIARVQKEFPELRSARPTQIQLLFNDQYNGESYLIRGASDAWAHVLSIQSERCVIDVKFLEDAAEPPSYIGGPRACDDSDKMHNVNVHRSGKGRRGVIKRWFAMLWKH